MFSLGSRGEYDKQGRLMWCMNENSHEYFSCISENSSVARGGRPVIVPSKAIGPYLAAAR
jgi:hypothetical protein